MQGIWDPTDLDFLDTNLARQARIPAFLARAYFESIAWPPAAVRQDGHHGVWSTEKFGLQRSK
jgi:hypothetical protein